MKIIGIELRVKPIGQMVPIEAKVLPFELELPEVIGFGVYGSCEVEMTVHTSLGDVTTRAALPREQAPDNYRTDWNSTAQMKEYQELKRRIEAMK